MATEESGVDGERFVLLVYVAIVLVSGVFGFVIGAVRPADLDPELFFLIQLPPTPLGLALYGMGTVATGLGALLFGVRYVSRTYDLETGRRPGAETETETDESDR